MRETHYWSDKPCPKGHVGLRYKSSWQCVQCTAERRAEITKNKAPIYQANRRHKYATDEKEREIVTERNRRWREENGAEFNARRRERWRSDPEWREQKRQLAKKARAKPGYTEAAKAYQLQYHYGLTKEEFDAMVTAQQGCCAICTKKAKLVVDHCHDTGAVRGLLCHHCNRGMGFLGDSAELLQAASDYVRRSKCP